MLDYQLEHPDYHSDTHLDEKYGEWLEENCSCKDDCECMDFDKWLDARLEEMSQSTMCEDEETFG